MAKLQTPLEEAKAKKEKKKPIIPASSTPFSFSAYYSLLYPIYGADTQFVINALNAQKENTELSASVKNVLDRATAITSTQPAASPTSEAIKSAVQQAVTSAVYFNQISQSRPQYEEVANRQLGADREFEKRMEETSAAIEASLERIDQLDKKQKELDKITPEGTAEIRERMKAISMKQGGGSPYGAQYDGFEVNTPDEYKDTIAKSAEANGVPTSILSSLLAHESITWNKDVISGKLDSPVGARGIAQFMPETAKGLGINPLNTKEAIEGAARYLKQNYNRFGSWETALAAYNAGPGAVQEYNGIPPYDETKNYVSDITKRAKEANQKRELFEEENPIGIFQPAFAAQAPSYLKSTSDYASPTASYQRAATAQKQTVSSSPSSGGGGSGGGGGGGSVSRPSSSQSVSRSVSSAPAYRPTTTVSTQGFSSGLPSPSKSTPAPSRPSSGGGGGGGGGGSWGGSKSGGNVISKVVNAVKNLFGIR